MDYKVHLCMALILYLRYVFSILRSCMDARYLFLPKPLMTFIWVWYTRNKESLCNKLSWQTSFEWLWMIVWHIEDNWDNGTIWSTQHPHHGVWSKKPNWHLDNNGSILSIPLSVSHCTFFGFLQSGFQRLDSVHGGTETFLQLRELTSQVGIISD